MLKLVTMTETQVDARSLDSVEEPSSTRAHPEVTGVGAVLRAIRADSRLVTVAVAPDTDPDTYPDLMAGAAEATRILGLDELHVIAPAAELPGLAVVAAEIAHLLPGHFQFCESGCCGHLHPEDATELTPESVRRLGERLR